MVDNTPIIIALDFPNKKTANVFLERINGQSCKFKVGLELFSAEGPAFIEKLVENGHQVFLDLKLHDIPNTVASACKALSNLGVWMTTLHASGGMEMMQAAQEVNSNNINQINLIAVTVLTSLAHNNLSEIGINQSPKQHVVKLAELAMKAKMDGIVCSVHEVSEIRSNLGNEPIVVTPGIRLNEKSAEDQSRIASPAQAKHEGASYIVVGRPITRASDPILAIKQIKKSWEGNNIY